MRKVIYGAACSMDGFIAGPADEVDWLHWSDDVASISQATLDAVDTLLMGRKTYAVAVRSGIRAYPGVRNYVFSRTLEPAAYPEVEVVTEDAAPFVARLVEEPGRDICVMGGGELARSLLAAGLLDEVGLNVHPVILGAGIPMFPPGFDRTALALEEARPIDGGCMLLRYRVRAERERSQA
jgi:dihydrofolate reductase